MKSCIIITGPTAVGKTAIAIAVAKHFYTGIISADSRQCYKELDIGVAKPSAADLSLLQHYFINSHSIQETVNADIFEKYALEKVYKIFEQADIAVMVGGTGLYIKAFCSGLDAIPAFSPEIRKDITIGYENNGLEWLQQQVQKADPAYFSKGEIQNPHRLLRALEVKESTGKSITEYQTQKNVIRDFRIIQIGLKLPGPELYQRINSRVEDMIKEGLVNEVKGLLPYRQLKALQTVGYKELFDYLDGKISMEEAVELIKLNTRHYAKRQLTWFKKDPSVIWSNPDFKDVLALLSDHLREK